jgi:hypothetical protein
LRVSNRTALLALALLAINLYICRELFAIEYLRHMGSIEGAFIGIARYAMRHWNDLTWFPLWYSGIPYQNTYPPLLHLGVALWATVTGMSPAHAYHFVVALAYCLGPLALFALTLRLSGSRWAAFAAGLIYSTLSMSAWIMPAVRTDLGSAFYPRRLQALVYYGEGPHVSSLTLLPFAILAIELAMRRRRGPYFALAAVMLAATALTNWFGAVTLALAIVCLLIAKIGERQAILPQVLWIAGIGATAYCLAMPLVPPSTIFVTQVNAKQVEGNFLNVYGALPLRGAVIVVVLVLLKFAIRRLRWQLQFAIFFSFLLAVLSITAVNWSFNILPQAARYQVEMEMAFALLIALVGQSLLKDRAATIAIALLVIAVIQPIRRDRNYARNFLDLDIDITKTSEWKSAQWLNRNWNGERVMMPGSTGFFLAAFSDTPELAGGYDPGRLETVGGAALYEIYTSTLAGSHDAEYSILWLKALGVQAVGVGGPHSHEYYRPFLHPAKFDGALEVLWREDDDTIYRVQPQASLARIVPRSALVSREPINGIDIEPLRPYVAALDDPSMPHADFQWTSAHSAKIHGTLRAGQVISVQEAWHRGWHANVPVERDALGQIVVDPGREGPFDVDLIYDGGTEMKIAHALRWLAAGFLCAWIALHVILKMSW